MSRKSLVRDKIEESCPLGYTVVCGIDGEGESWTEAAELISYTSSGVCFYLSRPCKVGSLISLDLALPAHLRCYDHDEESYAVWGLVQICYMSTSVERSAYQVCVALVGKTPPRSHKSNPLQDYRICGMNEDGLWRVTESDSAFVQRNALRFWAKIELYLAIIDARRETVGGERTTTENISRNGAAVVTSLDVNIGDRVKLISEEFDFSGLAVVCNTQVLENAKTRLNLEFVACKFPVEKLRFTKQR